MSPLSEATVAILTRPLGQAASLTIPKPTRVDYTST